MVSNTGRTPDTRRIRRLKEPRPVRVSEAADGTPEAVLRAGEWRSVSLARRPWRVDQQWWRSKRLSRMYYRVASEDGPPLTLFRDLVSGEWFRQEF